MTESGHTFHKDFFHNVLRHKILDAIGDGISIQDRSHRVLYQNRAHRKFAGDHLGKYCYQAYEKRDEICEGCPVRMSFSDGDIHTRERMVSSAEGALTYYEITASPIRDSDGNIVAAVETIRDITRYKKIDEKLKVMDRAVKSSSNAIVLSDLNSNLTYVNPSFLRMWGYDDESEVMGRPCIDFWLEKEMSETSKSSLMEKGHWSGERTAVRRDGSVFIAELSASLVTDDSGRPLCMMASITDISHRRKMEDEIRERVLELENFYKIAVNREVRMKELKEEIIMLKSELESIR
ncbi:MAG: PAS domain S-box protein [Nitrospirae bacterium]|nr:PAS domain S-box protein [Nitrospirota bacterium]